MSELNNNNNNKSVNDASVNKKEKKSFKIKVWKLLLAYLFIAVAVTSILIIMDKNEINTLEGIVEVTENKEEKIELYGNPRKISLKEKYAPNNIEVENIEENYGDIIEEYDYNNDGVPEDVEYRVSVSYLQISGLKNKKVEDKINKIILDRVNEFKKEYLNEEKYPGKVNINISSYDGNGFANTLSVSVNVSAYRGITDRENSIYYWDSECLAYITDAYNFRLDNGEEFLFEEIFTNDADINYILSQAIFEELIFSQKYSEVNEDGLIEWEFDMNKVDYGQVENDVIRELNRFKRNRDNMSFYVTARSILISYESDTPEGGYAFVIDMYDFVDYIGIYTRFLTDDSLFENGNLDERTYVFRYVIEDEYASEGMGFQHLSDNVMLQMSTHAGPGYEEQVNERASKVRNYLIRNSEKDKVFIYGVYIDWDERWETANGNVQIISKSYYDEYKDYILRYLDNYYYDGYEEPKFDLEQIEYKYFDIRFDEDNNPTFDYDDTIIEEIEDGSDEVLPEDETTIDDSNSYQNTVINTVSIDNTVDNSNSSSTTNTTNSVNTNTVVKDEVVEEEDDYSEEDLIDEVTNSSMSIDSLDPVS